MSSITPSTSSPPSCCHVLCQALLLNSSNNLNQPNQPISQQPPIGLAAWALLATDPAAIPRESDTPSLRPAGTISFTNQSVLDWHHGINSIASNLTTDSLAASALVVTRSMSHGPQTHTVLPKEPEPKICNAEPETSDVEQSPTASETLIATPTQQSLTPSAGVWHEEIWLNTAIHQSILQDSPISIPPRFQKRLIHDFNTTNIAFINHSKHPLTIHQKRTNIKGILQLFNIPPPSQRIELIVQAHIFGHFGLFKTRARIEELGNSWSGIEDDITQVIKRCHVCLQVNTKQQSFEAAQAIPIPHGVFDQIHMDLLELPESEEGFVYIFLIVDRLSKYPIAFPLQKKEASLVAKHLFDTICIFGTPTTINSDQGREFVNTTVQALCNLYGIDRRISSAYRPQANGQVERVNQSLLAILRKCTTDAPRLWPEWLNFALLAIRTSVHAATGFTPFEIMFGRPFRQFLTFPSITTWTDAFKSPQLSDSLALISQHFKHTDSLRASAHHTATESQIQQRATQNASHHTEIIRLPKNSTVFIKEPRPDHKLAHRFIGPFKTHASSSTHLSDNYILADPQGRPLQQSFPRDQLYLVVQAEITASLRQQNLFSAEEWSQAAANCNQTITAPLPNRSEDLWIVEKILDRTIHRRGNSILVKWSGYEKPEWIPEVNVDNDTLQQLLHEWRLSNAMQSGHGAPSRMRRKPNL